MPKDVYKENLMYLDEVFEYRNRTIGICFIKDTEDLEIRWEEAQYELGSKYQYQGENEKVWDYYLVMCCAFDEASLGNESRFRIESDRFCCRKVVLFGQSKSKFSVNFILNSLFPQIQSLGRISILKPEDFIPDLKVSTRITREFFTRRLNDSEIAKLLKELIIEASPDDKN